MKRELFGFLVSPLPPMFIMAATMAFDHQMGFESILSIMGIYILFSYPVYFISTAPIYFFVN